MFQPDAREKARDRVLEAFKQEDLHFNEPWNISAQPDYDILDEIEVIQESAMQFEPIFPKQENDPMFDMRTQGYVSQVVMIDPVQKITKQGSILSFRALVIVGNQRGAAGYYIGKGLDISNAIRRGEVGAIKNFQFIDRFDQRTLYHEVEGKFNSSKVFIRPRPDGSGTKASDVVAAVTYCFGLQDIVSKCHGNRNPHTVVKATFQALAKHQTAEEIAMKTGRSVQLMNKMARRARL